MIDFKDMLPKEVHMWSMQAAHTNSTLNPVLYYYFNPQIEGGFKILFNKMLCKSPPVTPLYITEFDTIGRLSEKRPKEEETLKQEETKINRIRRNNI